MTDTYRSGPPSRPSSAPMPHHQGLGGMNTNGYSPHAQSYNAAMSPSSPPNAATRPSSPSTTPLLANGHPQGSTNNNMYNPNQGGSPQQQLSPPQQHAGSPNMIANTCFVGAGSPSQSPGSPNGLTMLNGGSSGGLAGSPQSSYGNSAASPNSGVLGVGLSNTAIGIGMTSPQQQQQQQQQQMINMANPNGMLSELIFSSRNAASVSVADRLMPNGTANQFTQSCSISLAAQLGLNPFQLAQRLIEKFVAAHGDKAQKNILIKEEDIKIILDTVRGVFMSQPMLMEVAGPLKICGDTHGQFYDLLRIFEKCGFPSATNSYLFLGDYVDRGKHSIETMLLLFCYKIVYPTTFTLLRGNHECASINRQYGFFDDVKRRYNVKLFKLFTGVFDTMPICGVVSNKIICMHGGLSPDLGDVQLVNRIPRPCDVPHDGIMCDLLWSDPSEDEHVSGFLPSNRGVGWEFGPDMVEAFLDHVDMDLIVRAHQVQERGYGFFANRQLVTIFSAPGYCGEFDNDAAVMNVDAKLQCSFTVVPPRQLLR